MASRGARPDSPRYRPRPLRWPATTTRKRLGLGFGAMVAGFSETRRTPGPAAGCNKPATSCAEEAVEVVRNHEDGTRLDGWCRRPAALRSHRHRVPRGSRPREWTRTEHVGGGANKSRTPGEAGSRCPSSELRLRIGETAKDPAIARTLRRRQRGRTARSARTGERSWSADADWFASRQRRFGDVLEGPGLVTAEGRGGRRKYPTTCSPENRGDPDAWTSSSAAPQASKTL
jgi:hypothetical protein